MQQKTVDSIEVLGVDSKSKSVEFKPKFSGGLSKFYKYIADNFRAPDGVSGKIIVSIVIDVDGSLTDCQIVKDIGEGAAAKLIEFLKNGPKFTPGKQNGKPVRVKYNIPVTITGNY